MRLLRADLEPLPAAKSTAGWGDEQELKQALTTMTQLIIKQYIRDILQKIILKRAKGESLGSSLRLQGERAFYSASTSEQDVSFSY